MKKLRDEQDAIINDYRIANTMGISVERATAGRYIYIDMYKQASTPAPTPQASTPAPTPAPAPRVSPTPASAVRCGEVVSHLEVLRIR